MRLRSLRFGSEGSVALGQMAIAVLHHHNGRVDEHADGQRQTAQRHDVGADVEVVHGNEGRQHRNRQSKDGHQCGTEVKEKRDADEADDDGFENQVALERVD